ncbi:MAG: hypothetical protein ACTSUX_12640 [Promethearchaeota archaeon]
MENKYSQNTEILINKLLTHVSNWKHLFKIDFQYFYDGWAIYLKEKLNFPRLITIFWSYQLQEFSIKSFELRDENDKYGYELFFKEKIKTIEEIKNIIKDVIYGMDLIHFTLNKK